MLTQPTLAAGDRASGSSFGRSGRAVAVQGDVVALFPWSWRIAAELDGRVQGSEALWSGGLLSQFGTYGGQAAAGRVDAELGYGLLVGRRFVGTPRVGFGSSAYGRTYQFGYRLGALGVEEMDFELGLAGRRRESPMLDGGDLGVLGRVGRSASPRRRRSAAELSL